MRSCKRSCVDRISNLPCNVLDTILECMPLKDAVKTSILSKDWRYKWTTCQQLVFDENFFKSHAHDAHQAKLTIYQVLMLHKGPILKFKLLGQDFKNCSDIDHWILFLSNKNVFTLKMHGSGKYRLPSHLFTFLQLTHLDVCGCLFQPPPSFKAFEKLVNFDLQHATLVPSVINNLLSGCPLLQRVRLMMCENVGNIEIDSANLKCFEYCGTLVSICCKNTPKLGKVIVCINFPFPKKDASAPTRFNFTKLFHYTPSLQELELNGFTLEYLTMRGLPESPPAALKNVKSLKIPCLLYRNTEEVSGVLYLIRSCPKLQELTFDCEGENTEAEPVIQFLERARSVSYGMAKVLRKVHWNMFSGGVIEMELVRFILASAPLLEEIYIWNIAHHFIRPAPHLINEMKQFQQASPNVEFELFELKEEEDFPTEAERDLILQLAAEAEEEARQELMQEF